MNAQINIGQMFFNSVDQALHLPIDQHFIIAPLFTTASFYCNSQGQHFKAN